MIDDRSLKTENIGWMTDNGTRNWDPSSLFKLRRGEHVETGTRKGKRDLLRK